MEIYPFQRAEQIKNRQYRPSISLPRIHVMMVGKPFVDRLVESGWLQQALFLWTGAFVMGRAFMLGEILPFASAYVAAFFYRERRWAWGVPLFTIVGLMTVVKGYLLWSNIMAVCVLSLLFRRLQITEARRWLFVPLTAGAVLMAAKTGFLLFNHFTFYREIVVVFESIITGILTFIFLVVEDVIWEAKKPADFNFEDTAAVVIMTIGIFIGLGDAELFGLSLHGVATRLAIMLAAYLWGFGTATAVGVGGGIIPAVSTAVLPGTLGIYAISGLLAGAFRPLGRAGIIVGFVLGNLILSVFILDYHLAVQAFWETAVAVLLFLLIPESIREQLPYSLYTGHEGKPSGSQVNREYTAERMESLARVFEEMSMTFSGVAPQTDGGENASPFAGLFEALTGRFCSRCVLYHTCWEQEFYQTYREIFDVFSIAEMRGSVTYEDLPVELRRRCMRPRELATAINGVMDAARLNDYWEEKVEESKTLLSTQLKGISGLLKDLASQLDTRTEVDNDLRTYLLAECKRLEIPVRNIIPIINSANELFIKVTANSCVDRETCDTTLAPGISSLLGARYEVSQRRCPRSSWGVCEFTLARAFSYRVVTGAAQLAVNGVCGDSFNIATLKDGRELIVLSDGMGIGEKAHQESRATVNLLEELLNTGFDQDVALRTVNAVLLLRSQEENFATVDLALINLYSGETELIKVGGVTSFLKRDRLVGMITASTLPVGIVEDVEVPVERRHMVPGDILVMVTDGVLEPNREESGGDLWLRTYLGETSETDPQRLADDIINKALAIARGKPRDDMTVVCCRLEAAR